MRIQMRKTSQHSNGFTLIEVLVAMVVSMMVLGAVGTAFFGMQTTALNVDQRSNMALNSRGAMYLIEDSVRLMGFNPQRDISGNNIVNTATGAFLSFNRNDLADPINAADDTITIGLNAADDTGRDGFADNGVTSLVIDGGNVADDIEAIRFAYAYDDDGDGNVDLSANNFIIWAIDSDDDGFLDTTLDTDDDGDIDAGDAVNGGTLSPRVDISRIRAVKVWLVVRSQDQLRGSPSGGTMVVGDQRYTPNDDFAHNLFTTTVRCRNKA